MLLYESLLNRANAVTLGMTVPFAYQIQGHTIWNETAQELRRTTAPKQSEIEHAISTVSAAPAGSVVLVDAELLANFNLGYTSWPIYAYIMDEYRRRRPDLQWVFYIGGWADRGASGTYVGSEATLDYGTLADCIEYTKQFARYMRGKAVGVSPDLYERPNSTTTPGDDFKYVERNRWILSLCREFDMLVLPCISPIYFPSSPKTLVPFSRLQVLKQLLEDYADGWILWADGTTTFASNETWIPLFGRTNYTRSDRENTSFRDGLTSYWVPQQTLPTRKFATLTAPTPVVDDGKPSDNNPNFFTVLRTQRIAGPSMSTIGDISTQPGDKRTVTVQLNSFRLDETITAVTLQVDDGRIMVSLPRIVLSSETFADGSRATANRAVEFDVTPAIGVEPFTDTIDVGIKFTTSENANVQSAKVTLSLVEFVN